MKCVCGYEGEYFLPMAIYYRPHTNKKKKWDADFNKIWACPKCGTLKVEVQNDKQPND
jgi:hypothetical protein